MAKKKTEVKTFEDIVNRPSEETRPKTFDEVIGVTPNTYGEEKTKVRFDSNNQQSASDQIRERSGVNKAALDAIELINQKKINPNDYNTLPDKYGSAIDRVKNNGFKSNLNTNNAVPSNALDMVKNKTAVLNKKNDVKDAVNNYSVLDNQKETLKKFEDNKPQISFLSRKYQEKPERVTADDYFRRKEKEYNSLPHDVRQLVEDTYSKYVLGRPEVTRREFNQLKDMGYDPYDLMDYKRRETARIQQIKNVEEAQSASTGRNILQNAKTVGATVFNGFDLVDQLDSTLNGTPYDPALASVTNYKEAVREETSKRVYENAGGGLKGSVATFIYNNGMSMLDSATAMAAGALTGSEATTLFIMASSAAASGYKDAINRGATEVEAAATAFAYGIFEVLMEKIPLDHLIKMSKSETKITGKTLLRALNKQSRIEGTEEVLTTLADSIADFIINKDHSEYYQIYQDYLNNDYSKADALKNTAVDYGKNLAQDYVGGRLSGFVFGGIGSAVGNYNASQFISTASEDTKQKIYDTSKNLAAEDEATAKELADKVEKFDELSPKEQRQMVQSLAALQEKEITKTISNELSQRIEDDSTVKKAEQLFDKYNNSKITDEEFENEAGYIANNDQEKSAIIELKNDLNSGKVALPVNETIKAIETDRQIDIYNKQLQKEIARQDREASANLKKYEAAITAKEKFTAAKGVAAVTIKENDVEIPSKVLGIKELAGSETMLKTEGGKTVKLSSATFKDPIYGKLYNEVSTTIEDEKVANLSLTNYKGQPIESYVDAYRIAYEAGKYSVRTNEDVKSFLRNHLNSYEIENMGGTNVAAQVFYLGKNDASNYKKVMEQIKGKPKAVTYKKKSNAEDVLKTESELKHLIAVLAEKTNTPIEEIQSIKDKNGNYSSAIMACFTNGVIKVSDNTKNEIQSTLHEIMEKLKKVNPDGYNLIVSEVMKYVQETKGTKALVNALKAYQASYYPVEGYSTTEDIADEYTNDFVAGILTSPEGLESLAEWAVKDDPKVAKNLFSAISDFFKVLLDELHAYMDSHKEGMNPGVRDGYEATGKRIEALRQTVFAELEKMGNESENVENNKDDSRSFQLDLSEEELSEEDIENYNKFSKVIDNHIKKPYAPGKYLKVMDSVPQLLQDIGLEDTEIYMAKRHFNDITHKESKENGKWHGLTIEEVKQAPYIINNPAIIIDSLSREDSIVVISHSLDYKKRPIIISISRDQSGKLELDTNFMTSMYGRNTFKNYIERHAEKNKVLYINKKRSHILNSGVEVQFLESLSKFDFDMIIHPSENIVKTDIVNKNLDDKTYHSIEVDSNGNNLSEQQIEYFKDSVVRDKEGKLQVMYHGTNNGGFTVFDVKKARSMGTYGSGFYFTSSDAHATTYTDSDNLYKVYLNITNPVNTESKTFTKKQITEFINAVSNEYGIEDYGEFAKISDIVNTLDKKKSDFDILQDINATCVGNFTETVKFFNEIIGTKMDGIIVPTETVAFYPKQIKLVTNENPTSNPDIRYQVNVNENEWTEEEKDSFNFENNGNVRFTSTRYISNDLWQAITKEFKKLGYDFKDWRQTKEYFSSILESPGSNKGILLNDDQAKVINKLFNKNQKEEVEIDRTEEYKKIAANAEKHYGTTSNWNKAAYLTVNGKLIDFSDGQSYRVKDHREISEVLNLSEDAGYSDGLIEFMKEGNIRLQTYGIDIAVKPNQAQKSMLRTFFNKLEGEVTVDFSRLNGDNAGSAEYVEGTASSRILNDIDSFFETGEVPEGTYDGNTYYQVNIPEYTLPDDYAFQFTNDEEMDARFDEIERQEGIIKDFWKKIIDDPDFKALRFRKERSKNDYVTYILHESTRPGIDYQLSYYDDKGAIGHNNYYKSNIDKLYQELTTATLFEKDRGVQILPEWIEQNNFQVDIDDDLSIFEAAFTESEELREARNIIKNTVKSMKGFKISDADIRKIASSIKTQYKTATSIDDISDSLKSVFNYMSQDNVNYDALVQIMSEIAKPILENANTITSTRTEEWDKFRSYMAATKFKLNAKQVKEVVSIYGSIDNYRKKLFGVTTVSQDASSTLDEIWDGMVDDTGNILPAAIEDVNMPEALLQTINGLRPVVQTENTFGMNLEAASYDLALEIYRKFFETQSKSKNVDAAIAKVKEQQKAYREKAVDKYKKKYEEIRRQLAEQKKKNIKKLAEEIRNSEADLAKALEENDEMAAAIIKDLRNKQERKIEQLKKQKDKEIARIKAKDFDAKKAARDRRKNTILKEELRKQIKQLNKMLKSPSTAHFIKPTLIQGTIEVLETIDLETGKSKNMTEQLLKLHALYERYKNDNTFSFDYDENTANMIDELRELFEGRNYTELSNDELSQVLDMVNRVKTQIRNAGKLLRQEKYKSAKDAAVAAINEVYASKGQSNVLKDAFDDYMGYQLNAYRWFRKVSDYKDDGALMSIYNSLDEGQLRMINMQKEINEMFIPVLEGKENQENVKKIQSIEKEDLVNINLNKNGEEILATREMMLSVLMHVQNAQNARHIIINGFRVPDMELYKKGQYEKAYSKGELKKFFMYDDLLAIQENLKKSQKNVTMDDAIDYLTKYMQKLAEKYREENLTEWEKEYLKVSEELFHNYLGTKINEVSIESRGYALAKVVNYFPIKSDPDFTRTEFAALKQDGTLEGMGFLKERVKASNPILLESLSNVIMRQTDNTSRYYGFSIPVRNIDMIMGISIRSTDRIESLKYAIDKTWGKQYLKIFQNILQDVQTGRGNDSELGKTLSTLRGNFAAATLTANVGVAMKQAASYPTAAAVLGREPLIKAIKDIPKGFTNQGIAELEAINPLLWYRSQGQSSADITYAKQSDVYKKLEKYPLAKAISVDLIQNIDSATVRTLEYASMYYVDMNFSELEKRSEEYWNKVSEVFTKVVEETQPNYTVLQRPEILKDSDSLVRQLFVFKTQPFQNLGILYDALGEYLSVRKHYNKDQIVYKKAVKKLTDAIWSQLVAAALFSGMTLASNILYFKWYKYNQKDDKTTFEEMLLGVLSTMGSTLAGIFAGGDWLYSAIMEWVFKQKNYGIEISVVEMFNNLGTIVNKYITNVGKFIDADTETQRETALKNVAKNTDDAAELVGQYIGVPYNNIKNAIGAIYLPIKNLYTGEEWGTSKFLWEESTDSQYMRMFDALISNDMDRYNKLLNDQIVKGKKDGTADPEKNAKTKIKSMLKDAYLEKEFTAEEIKKYLDAANINYDNFTFDEWDYKAETGATSYSKYSRMNDAIKNSYENNADRTQIKKEIDNLLKLGVDKKAIAQAITSQYKPIYLQNKNANLKNLLVSCYMACGYTKSEAMKRIESWK